MKILVLNGSPRPNGNTAAMIKTFKTEAESNGHSVVDFNVCRMNIKGCLACEYCHGKGHIASQRVALGAGFVPAWAELVTSKINESV